jgi:hypothetical protein
MTWLITLPLSLIPPLEVEMTQWELTYRLPTTGSKYHKMIVEANYQHDAKKIAQAQVPSATICGGARRIH